MDAIDYSGAFGAGGVNPMQAFNQSLALGSNIMQQRAATAQAEAQRIAAEAEAERQAKIAEMMGNLNTADDYRKLAIFLDPEQAKAMEGYYTAMKEDELNAALAETGQIVAAFENNRPDVGIELLKMQAKAAPDEQSRAFGNMLVQIAESGELGVDGMKELLYLNLSFMPGGDKVLDSVQQAEKAPLDIKKLIADTELTDAQKKEALARAAKLEIETQNLLKEKEGTVPPEKVAEAEDSLRKELYSNTKDFQTISYNYDVIKSAETTGIGDAALVFGIMKMYDPGSTVREGEQATAANSGGIPAFYTGLYNKLIGGGTMSETVRKQIKSQAGKIYDTAKAQADIKTKLVEDIARRRGLNLANIRTPPEDAEVKTETAGGVTGSAATPKTAQPVVKGNK